MSGRDDSDISCVMYVGMTLICGMWGDSGNNNQLTCVDPMSCGDDQDKLCHVCRHDVGGGQW